MKIVYADTENNEYFKELNPTSTFIIPRKGDIIKCGGVKFETEGVIHNYDKKKIIVVVKVIEKVQ